MTEVPGFDVEEWKVAVLNPKAIHTHCRQTDRSA